MGEIKRRGRRKKYDCLIGISGGLDSSYMVYLAHVFGLRALLFHFDNGWNTEIAESNMTGMVERTGFDFVRIRVNDIEYNKLNLAFLKSGVSDVDIPNDIAMAKLMLTVAKQYKIKSILNGHSFRTEGSCPIGWTYMDGAYVADVYRKEYGVELKNYPLLTVWDQWFAALRGIKHYRILYHLDHDKLSARQVLEHFCTWNDYGGHHCENEYTMFAGWWISSRYGIEKSIIEYSAFIRSGLVSKQQAVEEITTTEISQTIKEKVYAKLGMTTEIHSLPHTYRDFKTYKQTFENLKWLIWVGVKLGFMPRTFYTKYCK
jgi:7-cyano-7-deazaguanine synthase in queuosine biosynthesis